MAICESLYHKLDMLKMNVSTPNEIAVVELYLGHMLSKMSEFDIVGDANASSENTRFALRNFESDVKINNFRMYMSRVKVCSDLSRLELITRLEHVERKLLALYKSCGVQIVQDVQGRVTILPKK